MTLVEGNCVSGHQTAHDLAERCTAGTKQKMEVVRDQGPGVALGLGLFEDDGQAVEERLAVFVVTEELSSLNSPGHDVLEEAGSV